MKDRFGKRFLMIAVILVMLMSLASPVRLWSAGYDPINMDLNDPNDPTEDTCFLPDDVEYYDLYNMRPIIDTPGVVKYVYTDKSFKDDYLITDNLYYVGYRNEVTLYVKFVWVMWNGDTQSKYYFVVVHGPTFSEYMYMDSLAEQSTYPIMSNEGTEKDPYEATITVLNSKDQIKLADIKRTPDNGMGYALMYPTSDFDIDEITDKIDLVVGENHIYIVILNEQGDMFKYYDITVVREPVRFKVTYNANGGTGADKEVVVFEGDDYVVEDNTFTPPTGYRFGGWNTAPNGTGTAYAPGNEIIISGDVILYAQWTLIPPTNPPPSVTYKANGGTGNDISVTVKIGDKYKVADNTFTPPDGHTFNGWNTAADGTGTAYAVGDEITISGSITLYAQWITDIPDDDTPLNPFISDHVAYIIGYPDSSVRPEKDITRAEVSTVYFRLLTNETRSKYWKQENTFQDVQESNWFNNAVSVMSNMGIVNGYSDGKFRPNGAITRAELAAIAARFARMMKIQGTIDNAYTDISGHWAEADIKFATSTGWFNGYPGQTFRPDQPITRAEFMTLVNRMLERIPQSPDDLLANDMISWVDNAAIDAWYYIAVQEATNSHVPEDKNDVVPGQAFKYEHWVEMAKTPDWAALEKEWANGVVAAEG
ncbi:MAG: S-layer homology domain-containing protein [Oscillospiraceae bacterium]|nr:S-layer homology domain-containing protein [Oscillospiraceae bacterium]